MRNLANLGRRQRYDVDERHIQEKGRATMCCELHTAVKNGDLREVRSLLDAGVDPNAKDSTGSTALHWAAETEDFLLVLALLDGGADVDARDGDGNTALHRAAIFGQEAAGKLLIYRGADVAARNLNRGTAMALARFNHEGFVQLLCEHGATE